MRVALKCGLAGSMVSIALWVTDLWSTGKFRLAGTGAAGEERVAHLAHHSIQVLEAKLLLLFAAFGFLIGIMAAAARSSFKKDGERAKGTGWAFAAAVTLLAHSLALAGMVARYPQLYADRWWLGGGILAGAQRVMTHLIGPWIFDLLLTSLILVLLAGTILGGIGTSWSWRRSRWTAMAVAVGLSVAFFVGYMTARNQLDDAPPNVLILSLEGLRTDRLESADVMPFTSSLLADGTLYRFAFTPIARSYPSWVSLLTGTEPRRNGVRSTFPPRTTRLDMGPTFISVLRDAGYDTFVVSDFAGGVFRAFPAGFDTVGAPEMNVGTLAQSIVFNSHDWALPLLRIGFLRKRFPIWRNQSGIADPAWLAREALDLMGDAEKRPFAGIVSFSTAQLPYAPPFPYYLKGEASYRGPYLYHVPPRQAHHDLGESDSRQAEALYDAALTSVDQAIEWLFGRLGQRGLRERTLVIVTSNHGEELYDLPDIAGHGDFVDRVHSQSVPILLLGPGVQTGRVSNRQVRLYDLGATVLDLVAPEDLQNHSSRFGDGISLRDEMVERPVCVETGLWFFPLLPAALHGKRLEYPEVAELLDIDETSRELVLRSDMEAIVESSKQRGLILGNQVWKERLTPRGLQASSAVLPGVGVEDRAEFVDLQKMFEQRCVDGDGKLRRFFGAVVYQNDEHRSRAREAFR
jgi:arylsulfatase A-like enzyme